MEQDTLIKPKVHRKEQPKEGMSKEAIMRMALDNPLVSLRKLNDSSLYNFVRCFWNEVSQKPYQDNWHIPYICSELEKIAYRVAAVLPKENDVIINIPPGMTKTITCSIMFPDWCWTKWPWMRFITAGYSAALSMEAAEYSRDLIRSDKFRMIYPDIDIKDDKDQKSNYTIITKIWDEKRPNLPPRIKVGGNRFSTSVGGTLAGFHGDILIIDDPLNPYESVSEKELANANRWIDETLPTRTTDKEASTKIIVMQRLHQDDPSGHILNKKKENVKHISLPGEIVNYLDQLHPANDVFKGVKIIDRYVDGLLDPKRLNWNALHDLEADLGQYGFAGQIGQNPTPPGGGMFHVDHFQIIDAIPAHTSVVQTIRYWDKAGTQKAGCFTSGTKMAKLSNGQFVIFDNKRGQWGTDERERGIKETAYADQKRVFVWVEQEPGPIWEEENIQMGNGTIKQLKDIKKGDVIINMEGIPTKVTGIHTQGKLLILKITTDSGRIIHVAYNHPFFTPNGWTNAEKLQIGDVLALKSHIKIKVVSKPSIEECRLAGYFIGDGCCTWTRNKEITCNSNIVCSDPLEGKDIIYCAEKLGFKVHVGGSKGWTYYISGGVKEWLKSKGLAGKNTFQKRIPEWILKSNNECVANFLGAYLACDGSVMNKKDHPCVEYYSTNLDLLKDTQNVLLRFGIYTMLRKRNYKDEFQKTRHFCYRITTRRSDGSMGRFAKYIPVYGVKGEKLKIFNHLNFDQPYISDPIVSIEKVDKLPCKCVTVENGDSFIVNGIIVHNSGGKESAEATIRMLAGFSCQAERPTGDKVFRADPYSVQVNNGNVLLMRGDWNGPFIEEHRFFPFSKYKDQVDSASGAFNKLAMRRIARRIT